MRYLDNILATLWVILFCTGLAALCWGTAGCATGPHPDDPAVWRPDNPQYILTDE